MLYIDQPVQTGFSYDTLVNGTINQIHSPLDITVEDFSISGVPTVNNTFLVGTFPSTNPLNTASLTTTAAFSAWQFMQTWTQDIWTESYGGHYGPTFANFFEDQNDRIENGEIKSPATKLHLDTLGIGNGCIDIESQISAYPQMAFNNTYGLQLMTEAEYQSALSSYPKYQSLIESCRSAEASSALSETAAAACSEAYGFCFKTMWATYNEHGRNVFDIGLPLISSWSPKFAAGYLNQAEVQQALGVPLNFTGLSTGVASAFDATGDFARGGNLKALGSLLDRGVKVALMYGDKDYQCNWLGGENASLHIPSTLSAGFRSAGYASLDTNSTYSGGFVRQYGYLSFTRVFNAGHEVPWYQPETAYQIFTRAMLGTDIATSTIPLGSGEEYKTEGPQSCFSVKTQVAEKRERVCYLWV
ncbi:uncharacterized protein BP5553_00794 [Venustampulla echinocandica]|uniref:Carboxypeptidase n=1 Tax=Venustampulla echinocandica TaxID=2656787 RepID=A0A370TZ78_9HELO|nr:uncharacterized protein BP5553_00794 [Venustampulla echinocandica]RDL40815.1 hypothetical protein BP5553_00794 [Venustampulla echinocandica]